MDSWLQDHSLCLIIDISTTTYLLPTLRRGVCGSVERLLGRFFSIPLLFINTRPNIVTGRATETLKCDMFYSERLRLSERRIDKSISAPLLDRLISGFTELEGLVMNGLLEHFLKS